MSFSNWFQDKAIPLFPIKIKKPKQEPSLTPFIISLVFCGNSSLFEAADVYGSDSVTSLLNTGACHQVAYAAVCSAMKESQLIRGRRGPTTGSTHVSRSFTALISLVVQTRLGIRPKAGILLMRCFWSSLDSMEIQITAVWQPADWNQKTCSIRNTWV